jgi:hypothetical protein
MTFSEGIGRYTKIKLINSSVSTLAPGDIVLFSYEGSQRIGFVVRSSKTGMGVTRITTRGNQIVNTFLLDSISPAMLDILINNLYKNRIRATYRNSPVVLGSMLGSDNFRTFISSKMSNIKEYFIDKKSLQDDDSE